mgnify:CR=1 FL=1
MHQDDTPQVQSIDTSQIEKEENGSASKASIEYNENFFKLNVRVKLNKIMIKVSDKAKKKVVELMTDDGFNPITDYVRVGVKSGGCSGLSYGMGFEKESEEDDRVIEENGVKVLVDSMSIDHLNGANVDYIESLMGSGFKINNPNVTKSCSCGSSFSTE